MPSRYQIHEQLVWLQERLTRNARQLMIIGDIQQLSTRPDAYRGIIGSLRSEKKSLQEEMREIVNGQPK